MRKFTELERNNSFSELTPLSTQRQTKEKCWFPSLEFRIRVERGESKVEQAALELPLPGRSVKN